MGEARSWLFGTFRLVTHCVYVTAVWVRTPDSFSIGLGETTLLPSQAALKVYLCIVD